MTIDPVDEFHARHYVRHTQRRLEHLATLGLPLAGRSVLEVGAGIGDHTEFFLDRGCSVVTTDGRPENVDVLRERFSWIDVRHLDLDEPDPRFDARAEIVYCYGTLYHLRQPARALEFLAPRCGSLMLVETCVSWGADERLELVDEPPHHPSQSISGGGSRPTRLWVYRRLQELFPHVYLPRTQPWHPEFPTDWRGGPPREGLTRAIFVGSRSRLWNRLLTRRIPNRQPRQLRIA